MRLPSIVGRCGKSITSSRRSLRQIGNAADRATVDLLERRQLLSATAGSLDPTFNSGTPLTLEPITGSSGAVYTFSAAVNGGWSPVRCQLAMSNSCARSTWWTSSPFL